MDARRGNSVETDASEYPRRGGAAIRPRVRFPRGRRPAPRTFGRDRLAPQVIFFYGHGQFSTELYDNIVETCTMDYRKYGCIGKPSGCAPAGCSDLITEMRSSVAGYYG